MFKFLGGDGETGGDEGVFGTGGINEFIASIATPLNYVMIAVLAVVALGAIAFAVYVAFRLAKAEDDSKRKEAKQQLLWSIIAVLATIGIFVLITTVFSDDILGDKTKVLGGGEDESPIFTAADLLLGAIFQGFSALLSLATTAAMLFAVWLGFKLATAEGDDKRKQAKNQLLWTVIAVAASIVLVVVINTIVWQVLIVAVQDSMATT